MYYKLTVQRAVCQTAVVEGDFDNAAEAVTAAEAEAESGNVRWVDESEDGPTVVSVERVDQ